MYQPVPAAQTHTLLSLLLPTAPEVEPTERTVGALLNCYAKARDAASARKVGGCSLLLLNGVAQSTALLYLTDARSLCPRLSCPAVCPAALLLVA